MATMIVRPHGDAMRIEVQGKTLVPGAVFRHAVQDVKKETRPPDVPAMKVRHLGETIYLVRFHGNRA